MNTFSIKEKWNGPNCPKSNTPQLWPAEILLPNKLPNTMVFIPINTSTPIPHEKPNLTTCTLIPPQPPQKKQKQKQKKTKKRKEKNCQAILCVAELVTLGLVFWTVALYTKNRLGVSSVHLIPGVFFNWKQTKKQKNYSSFSEKLADPSTNRKFF